MFRAYLIAAFSNHAERWLKKDRKPTLSEIAAELERTKRQVLSWHLKKVWECLPDRFEDQRCFLSAHVDGSDRVCGGLAFALTGQEVVLVEARNPNGP